MLEFISTYSKKIKTDWRTVCFYHSFQVKAKIILACSLCSCRVLFVLIFCNVKGISNNEIAIVMIPRPDKKLTRVLGGGRYQATTAELQVFWWAFAARRSNLTVQRWRRGNSSSWCLCLGVCIFYLHWAYTSLPQGEGFMPQEVEYIQIGTHRDQETKVWALLTTPSVPK